MEVGIEKSTMLVMRTSKRQKKNRRNINAKPEKKSERLEKRKTSI